MAIEELVEAVAGLRADNDLLVKKIADQSELIDRLRVENEDLRNRLKLNEQLATENEDLRAQSKLNERLATENEDLRARLKMNSTNSSKPPSSDGLGKPSPSSMRKKSGKKPGKQPGTKGNHLKAVKVPDAIVVHRPENCGKCGADLKDGEKVKIISRQVFDFPPCAVSVTEHQAHLLICSCGAKTTGQFPPEATAPTCFGPTIRSFVSYLVARQHIPIGRTKELLHDLCGISISTGSIDAIVNQGAIELDHFIETVKGQIVSSKVVNFDETGLRVGAKLSWVHSSSTPTLTLYHLDAKRGSIAMDAMGILPKIKGVAIHDGWVPYSKYDQVAHGLCNAHHLRELKGVIENTNQVWASQMAKFLTKTYYEVIEAGIENRSLSPLKLSEIHETYRRIISDGHVENPEVALEKKRGRPKRTKAHNLLLRLDAHEDDVLRFAEDFDVPFDNNLAERDIRMIKVHQKISGGFRTVRGAVSFLTIRSYLSTAAKHGVNLLEVLERLYRGNPWMPTPRSASG